MQFEFITIILKYLVTVGMFMDRSGSEWSPVVDFYEHDNGSLDSARRKIVSRF